MGGYMESIEIIKYMGPILSSVEGRRWFKKEYQIINDAFNLYKLEDYLEEIWKPWQ